MKGGVSLAAELATRTTFAIGARCQLLKKTLASAAVSIELHRAIERGLVEAAKTPLSDTIKESAGEVMESALARDGFDRATFSLKTVLDELVEAPNIKKLCQTEGREEQFWHRFAIYFQVMGSDASEGASKGWVRAYNRLLKFGGDVLEDDRAGDLLALYKTETSTIGKSALKKSLENFAQNTSPTSLHPDLKFLDVEKLSGTGFRYTGEVAWLEQRGWKYPVNDAGGWYCKRGQCAHGCRKGLARRGRWEKGDQCRAWFGFNTLERFTM